MGGAGASAAFIKSTTRRSFGLVRAALMAHGYVAEGARLCRFAKSVRHL